ncbi:MAG TPA: class I SAM-dependent methyltransferase [Ktedonobacteraceae bacterium]|jgi:SAM-dependent methyltransferase
MPTKGEMYHYGRVYAEKYINTIKRPYTQLKNRRIASCIDQGISSQTTAPIIVDIGGNIHGTVVCGVKAEILKRRTETYYIAVDVDEAYFDPSILHAVDPTIKCYPKNNIHGIVADARSTGLPNEHAHAVIIADTLEHIEEPHTVLQEANRILKADGILVVVSPAFYKADILKVSNTVLRDAIENRLSTSGHINFFDHKRLSQLLASTRFKINYLEGLAYASALPYLLWSDPEFVPQNEHAPATKQEHTFYAIRTALSQLTLEDHEKIDMEINNYDTGMTFINSFVSASHTAHPLDMIYEVLKICPHYASRASAINEIYQLISNYINPVKDAFDTTMLKTILDDFLQNNPYQYFANSVLIQANKTY